MTTSVVSAFDRSPAAQAVSWTRWLWVGVPMICALILYGRLFPSLVFEWYEFPNLSHGFAIPFIAAYLVWAHRGALKQAVVTPSLLGAPILLVGLAGFLFGTVGEESFLARLSLPVTLLGLTWFVAGTQVTREVWTGIAYLLFMIPPPWTTIKTLTYHSRLFDAWASAETLGLLGVPVLRDGFFLQLPNMTLEVADVCSSIPALAALFSLGVAYASLAQRSLGARLILIGATIPFAILSNIVRITTTAAAVYYIGPWTLQTLYHQFNGTVIFLFTLAMLFVLDSIMLRWARREPR